jgi:uncharacterized protein YbbK (DUF523 family)
MVSRIGVKGYSLQISTKQPTITIGISSCLLGNAVRYDGKHKRNYDVCSTLSHLFNFHAFCPEVAIGLGIPRPPIQLVQQKTDDVRIIEVENKTQDYTLPLTQYAEKIARTDLIGISGFIFKKSSPSCGMERVKVYKSDGMLLHERGVGLFAQVIQQQHPLLPVVEAECLANAKVREHFLQQVYTYYACSLRNGMM